MTQQVMPQAALAKPTSASDTEIKDSTVTVDSVEKSAYTIPLSLPVVSSVISSDTTMAQTPGSMFDACDCIIFDFDSTIINGESLELMLESVLSCDSEEVRSEKMANIDAITKLGMNGEINFMESLSRRLQIAKPTKKHLQEFVTNHCPGSISHGMKEFITEIQECGKKVFILSGGFSECIIPFAEYLGVPRKNVHAVEIVWSESGEFIDIDNTNQFAESKTAGAMLLKSKRASFASGDYSPISNTSPTTMTHASDASLTPQKSDNHIVPKQGYTIMVGDGYSDYKIYESGIAQKFFAYIEHAERQKVVDAATHCARSVADLRMQMMEQTVAI